MRYDYLVLGGGLAGLTVALHLSGRGSVLVATKQGLFESNSRYAQGGIAAALDEQDSPVLHARDTLVAGAGLCDERAVEVLTAEGPAAVRELMDLGVPFDTAGGHVSLGREGAHSLPRILHAGGDATGAAVVRTLAAHVAELPDVSVRQHTMLVDLEVRDGRVAGAWIASTKGRGEPPRLVEASAVVLATGGAGRLFEHTTNPPVATGDGVAAAFRAGALVADAEFFQFHPTALAIPGAPRFLISEAVRGEGGRLYAADGRRFIPAVHPQAELAPRDVVARAIAAEMARTGGLPVGLDVRHLSREQFTRRFPTIAAACARYGVDPSRDRIPVSPAAHYWMGGVWTDLSGRTSLPGLYACGEVACTGIHGANRLASNSLLEALVFGRRVAAAIGRGAEPAREPDGAWARVTVDRADRGTVRPIDGDEVRRAMWEHAGLVRSRSGLETVRELLRRADPAPSDEVTGYETGNLVTIGRLLAAAALLREESRGAHWRSDFPHADPSWARRIALSARYPEPLVAVYEGVAAARGGR